MKLSEEETTNVNPREAVMKIPDGRDPIEYLSEYFGTNVLDSGECSDSEASGSVVITFR